MKGKGHSWRSAAEYETFSSAWWAGRRVRLGRPLTTCGGTVYRKGRIARVVKKFGGLTLRGRGLYITRVKYWGIEVDTTHR